jgi:7-cyano-7-deazaguanine synthase
LNASVPANNPKAVVLLSGGLDSAVTLAVARSENFQCDAITFDYGQRHQIELDAARKVGKSLGVNKHVVMKVDLRVFGGSALTADIAVPKDRSATELNHGVPITYVPARNTIFLSLALGYAEVIGAADIFIGVNAVDYSGYPDCRHVYIEAFERMANLGTKMGMEGRKIHIRTPLIYLGKQQIIQKGAQLGVDYSLTTSCYDPDPVTAKPCGHCDSCQIRHAGFAAAGMTDPREA